MFNPYNLAKISRFLIYLTLFLPLAVIPFTLFEFIFARNLIFYFLSAVILVLGLIYLYKNKHNIDFKVNALFWLILAFVAIRVISGIFGVDPHNSFFGSQIRMDGNLGYIMLFGWMLVLLMFFNTEKDWVKLFKISVFVSFLVSIFAIVQAFFSQELSILGGKGGISFWDHRLTGSFGNSILLAGYLLPHVFLAFYIFVKEKIKKYKYFWLCCFFLFVLTIFLTGTRGAILSLVTTAVLIGATTSVFLVKDKKNFLKKIALFGVPAFVLLIFVIINTDLLGRLLSFLSAQDTIVTRFIFWKIGILGFLDKWILGWGPENFSYVFSKFYEPQLLNFSFYETWADKPHNKFVEIAATCGILGICLFLSIMAVAFKYLWKLLKKNKAYILIGGAIVSYLIHNFFAFDEISSRIVFFAVLAYAIFLSSEGLKKNYKISPSVLKALAIIILLVSIFSLKSIGIKTIKASFYANKAKNSIINNKYIEVKRAFKKLNEINTPYKNGNWEVLADFLLKANVAGRIPKTTMIEVLPMLVKGLEDAVEDTENNFSYNYRLGQMYNLAGEYINKKYFNKAIESLDNARKISPKRQVADLLLAHIYYSKKEVDKGIALLENMIDENPKVAEPYWFLGILFDADGKYDKSYAYMATAIEKGYTLRNINEMFLYVTVLGRYNDYARMESIYEAMIKLDGGNPRWQANIAFVYFENGKYEKAKDAARQAMFLDSKYADEAEDFLRKIEERQK